MKRDGNVGNDPRWPSFLFYFVVVAAVVWAWQAVNFQSAVRTIPYSEFKNHLVKHEVKQAAVKPDEITGQIVMPPAVTTNLAKTGLTNALLGQSGTNSFQFRTVRIDDPEVVKQLQADGAEYSGERAGAFSQFFLGWVLPVVLLIGLWMFLGGQFRTAGPSIFTFGRSNARMVPDKSTGVTFHDVAGCEEAKVELREVVDFLKTPQRYRQLGAKIPKGVLLIGPPGTGKTLLARAVAGEASVPFFSLSGSDFVEMFVGVGAARVRDLFQQAKQQTPCIIFIDEMDAIGRERGVRLGVANDEREQTLNQLLAEMDGFEPNTGVILLAATNRPEVLDHALLRPGRFDRHVVVDAPDVDGREAILKVHARSKPLAADVNLRRLAQSTAGFSGADLANTLNEAALLAARHQERQISQQDLEAAVEKVVAGPERKSRRLSDEQKRWVACHEAGHALVAVFSPDSDPVRKISIIPHGHSALGYTLQVPLDDQYLIRQSELLARIRGMLGGRAAEENEYGEVTTGAQNDLEHATALARQMVCLYGMSKVVGLANCAQRRAYYLDMTDGQLERDCSEKTAREIDEEVKRILNSAYSEAKQILTTHRLKLHQLVAELLQRESLEGSEVYQLCGQTPPCAKEQPSNCAFTGDTADLEEGIPAESTASG